MKLADVFTQLTCGELSQLNFGTDEPGVIDETNYAKLVPHVNLALIALYTRFPLKHSILQLALQEGQRQYQLSSSYAVNNKRSKEEVRYIIDTADLPFKDDILKVQKVVTAEGTEIAVNDHLNPYSIITPTTHTLRLAADMADKVPDLPPEYLTDNLFVTYRAKHPVIVIPMGYFDPSRVNIELPDAFLEALLYFIASRIHNPIGLSNEFNTGNNYAQKYELACRMLEQHGFYVDQGSSYGRARRNGWI